MSRKKYTQLYDVRSSALLLVISSYFIIFSLYFVDFYIRNKTEIIAQRHSPSL